MKLLNVFLWKMKQIDKYMEQKNSVMPLTKIFKTFLVAFELFFSIFVPSRASLKKNEEFDLNNEYSRMKVGLCVSRHCFSVYVNYKVTEYLAIIEKNWH